MIKQLVCEKCKRPYDAPMTTIEKVMYGHRRNLCENCYDAEIECATKNPDEIKEEGRKLLFEEYKNLVGFFDEWVDFDIIYKKLSAVWTIGTYFHALLPSYPFLHFNAGKGSAKSRTLRIISTCQRNGNGELLSNPSEAVLFRTAMERGLMIDEFEGEKDKDKAMFRQMLNVCYKKGGVVYRMEKEKIEGKEKLIAKAYPLYTPISFGSINSVEDVLADRIVSVVIPKSMNPLLTKKIEDFERNQTLKDIKANLSQISVGLCSVYPLQKCIDDWNNYVVGKYTTIHTYTTNTTIHNYTQDFTMLEKELFDKIDATGIYGRNLELLFPILLVAKMIDDSVFIDMIEIAKSLNVRKREEDFMESKDVSLIEFVSQQEFSRFNGVMSNLLFLKYKEWLGYTQDEDNKWLNNTWFGSALKRLGLVNSRKRVAKGIELLLNVDVAKEKLKMFKGDTQ